MCCSLLGFAVIPASFSSSVTVRRHVAIQLHTGLVHQHGARDGLKSTASNGIKSKPGNATCRRACVIAAALRITSHRSPMMTTSIG